MNQKEVWLRGPLADMPALLQPVAHALLQAHEEVNALMDGFPDELLWTGVAGLASPGFHLQHLTGVLNRLFTYASGRQLNGQQLEYLAMEGRANAKSSSNLVELFNKEVDEALAQLSKTNELTLTGQREVGRAKLPSTVMGLYVHAAEHTMRHLGQLLVTVKVLRGN
jgi:hypothetical protein